MLPTGALRRTVASCSIVHMSSQPQLRKASNEVGAEVIRMLELTEADLTDIPVLMEEFLSVTNRRISTVESDVFTRLTNSTNNRLSMLYEELNHKLSDDDAKKLRALHTYAGRHPNIQELQNAWEVSVQKLPDVLAFFEAYSSMGKDMEKEAASGLASIRRYNNALEQLTVAVPAMYPLMQSFVKSAFLVTNPYSTNDVRSDLVELDEQVRVTAQARDRYFVYRTNENLDRFLNEALAWRRLVLATNALPKVSTAFVLASDKLIARIESTALMEGSWS